MNGSGLARRFIFVIPALGIVVLDQLSKHWCMTHLKTNTPIPFLDHWLFLTLTYNPRGAFSLFPMPNAAFIAVIALLLVGLITYVLREKGTGTIPFVRTQTQLVVGLILGGGLGNLIDRVQLGSVVDFLDLRFWPVFNVADSAVSIGMMLFVLGLVRRSAE